MNYLKYLFFAFGILLLCSCGNVNKTIQKKVPSLSAVYNSFDEIAYLFDHQNDTTYVINFWATWCSPCVAELPYFEKVNEVYKDEKVKVVLVSLDSKKHIDSKLRPFIQKEKLMSEILALTDPKYNDWIDKVSPDWDGAIPATIIYHGADYEFIGGEFEDFDELNSIVKSYIKT